jgi:nitroimidazol reductase NimA-like FMN-containing flavoprotein (pyridoxamine 5'-phosphate oxidase superfamily)
MPGYGLPADERSLAPWSRGEEVLRDAHNYWVATARADGRPHLMPVWAVWHDGALWFSTGGESRKARNLAARAECSIGAERGPDSVIVEGTAERLAAARAPAELGRLYAAKYGGEFPGDSPLFRIEPHVAFGFSEEGEFAETATRWTFERA